MLDASGRAPVICCCAAAPVQHATKAIREFAIHETRLVMFSTHCCFEPIFVGWFDDNIKALPDCTRLIDRSERVFLFSGGNKVNYFGEATMSPHHIDFASRRRLLQFLAASPLFARGALAEGLRPSDPVDWAPRDPDKLIADPTQALDVFDFEPVMKKNVPPAHFGYMATGADDEVTLRANREGFRKFELRPRRLVDVSKIDISAEILGTKYDSPIVLAPTGSNRAFHPDAEVAVAKAAKLGNHLQILSTVATTSIEDAIAARGAPVWFQLYTTQKWEVAEALIKRAETAGAPAIAVTLDVRSSAKWETFVRLRRTDTWECGSCHGANDYLSRKPNFSGIELGSVSGTTVTNITWDTIKRLRDTVKTKIVLKGILAHEDAKLAADARIDAGIVSNHGGRVEDGVSATIDVLPDIVAAAGRMPVLV